MGKDEKAQLQKWIRWVWVWEDMEDEKGKKHDRRMDQIIAIFLPSVLIIYNICFSSTVCFSLYLYSA